MCMHISSDMSFSKAAEREDSTLLLCLLLSNINYFIFTLTPNFSPFYLIMGCLMT